MTINGNDLAIPATYDMVALAASEYDRAAMVNL